MDQLPEEIVVKIITSLGPVEDTLPILPCVCQRWSKLFDDDRTRFWALLAKEQGFSISSRIHKRSAKKSFIRRYQQVGKAKDEESDQIILKIAGRLKKNDCTAYVRKELTKRKMQLEIGSIGIAHRAVPSLEHRTLLHLASWHGRQNVVRMLVQEFGVSVAVRDDNNATPILVAAWAGHAKVVERIIVQLGLEVGHDKQKMKQCLEQEGVPPLTSSCGGRSPKTALEWAERKGFTQVSRLLLKAHGNLSETIILGNKGKIAANQIVTLDFLDKIQ